MKLQAGLLLCLLAAGAGGQQFVCFCRSSNKGLPACCLTTCHPKTFSFHSHLTALHVAPALQSQAQTPVTSRSPRRQRLPRACKRGVRVEATAVVAMAAVVATHMAAVVVVTHMASAVVVTLTAAAPGVAAVTLTGEAPGRVAATTTEGTVAAPGATTGMAAMVDAGGAITATHGGAPATMHPHPCMCPTLCMCPPQATQAQTAGGTTQTTAASAMTCTGTTATRASALL